MQLDPNKFSWFEVPEDIKNLLILAAQNWENTSESEKYIQQALAQTGENTDVLVAAYRFFYYKNNYSLAIQLSPNYSIVCSWRFSPKAPSTSRADEINPDDS